MVSYVCDFQCLFLPHPGSAAGRRYLGLKSANLLANALVSSRLDYCDSLLSGIADTDLAKLQRVQNRLAGVVTKSPPFLPQRSTATLPSLVLAL